MPIPFAEGLKITVSGELHFYHVLWESYPHGAAVRSFDGSEDRAALLGAFAGASPALAEADFLGVGNAASEAAHGYAATASELTGPVTGRGEGRHLAIEHREAGRRHDGGEIRFTVAIDPDNRGVRLRRRLDQASPRQTAEVWIGGQRVGVWCHADHNPALRWFDSDFDIHPRFTAGEVPLELRLVPVVGEGRGAFTDFRYRVSCFEGVPGS